MGRGRARAGRRAPPRRAPPARRRGSGRPRGLAPPPLRLQAPVVVVQLHHPGAVLVDDLAAVPAQVNQEAHLELLDALLDKGNPLLLRELWVPEAVHQAERERRAIAVGGLVYLLHARVHIQEVKPGTIFVDAGHEDVHLERVLPERLREVGPGPCGCCLGGELQAIPERVELKVFIHVPHEIRGVGSGPGHSEELILDHGDLVGVVFHLDYAKRLLAIRGHDHEVLASQAKRCLRHG
mmetsp:Transcript_116645/g.316776  ORF Transcript_116645/g.316776 Transcript_116645/m.316776 type:complete len:238 (+) Transcript_116645:31-744(+)